MDQQYILKEGLKRFGGNGEYAVTSELEQLQKMETFTPLDANKLTNKNIKEALASVMSLT